MNMHYTIQRATTDDVPEVAIMVGELLAEIMGTIGVPAFNFDLAGTRSRLADYLACEKYFVFLARDGEGYPVGFIALYECYALYAEGAFGTIPELYVRGKHRSARLGFRLVAEAKSFANSRGWRRLEVTTPPLPQFYRTLVFYEREGFSISGGRKLKMAL